ncbi:MAG: 30S ribosomal protein S2 [Planctomycetota bacterium]
MDTPDVQALIDAGVHFGCRVSRWNPKMEPYIHGRRNLIHVIDLRQTVRGLLRAQNFLYRLVADGQQLLWVGTKRQIKGLIEDAGERTGMPIVTERWIGGTLTNFSVVRSRLRRLEELEKMEEDGTIKQYSKKRIASLRREQRKITRNLSGIREMNGIPGAMVVVDPRREYNAVREARKLGLAVIGILDTDCDPNGVDIVIPGNDDALRSVRLMMDHLAKAVEEGGAAHREQMASVGSAQRQEEPAPGGEPRPTQAQNLRPREAAPRPESPEGTVGAEGSETSAVKPKPEAEPASARSSGEPDSDTPPVSE